MGEDLANWKPKHNLEYNGFDHGHHNKGYVIIYIKKENNILEEHHPAGFNIMNNQVKIWYMLPDGNKFQKFVPYSSCQFSKTKDWGKGITYYHVTIDDTILINKGNNMADNRKPLTNYASVEENEKGEVVIKAKPEHVSLWDRFSGRTGAIYLKDREEGKLKELWSEFESALKDVDEKNDELKDLYVSIPALRKEFDKKESEWDKELTSLANALNKYIDTEKKMWETTARNRKVKGLKVHQKFKDSDVDEVRFNNMMDYIKQYPELQTNATFKESISEIKHTREDIESKNREVQQTIKNYNGLLNKFEKRLQKAVDDLDEFEERMKEAGNIVNNHPYNKSKLFASFKTEYEKQATRLDLLKYQGKVKERRNKLEIIKNELSNYERKKFVDIEN